MKKLLVLLAGLLLACGLQAQTRWRAGIDLSDFARLNAPVWGSFSKWEHMEIEAAAGYALGRTYEHFGTIQEQVTGPYGSLGMSWMVGDVEADAVFLCGFQLYYGHFKREVEYSIPNYYGDVTGTETIRHDHWGLMSLIGGRVNLKRVNIDFGMRVGRANRRQDPYFKGSYIPGAGRSVAFKHGGNYQYNTWAVSPFLRVGYSFGGQD